MVKVNYCIKYIPDRKGFSLPLAFCLLPFLGGCVTTNIQSGGAYPPQDTEERFFQPHDERQSTYRAAGDAAVAEEIPLAVGNVGSQKTGPKSVEGTKREESKPDHFGGGNVPSKTEKTDPTGDRFKKERGRLALFGEEDEDRSESRSDYGSEDRKASAPEGDEYFVDDADHRPVISTRGKEGPLPVGSPKEKKSEGTEGSSSALVAPAADRGDGDRDRHGEKNFSTESGEYQQVGTASWYGRDFDGKRTANGEIFDSRKLSAAHRTLPLGTVILVRNMENKKELVVRINDRGPYVRGRVLDISEYGAEKLDFKEQGLTTVGIKVLRLGQGKARSQGATKTYYARLYPEDQKDLEREEKENFEKPLRPAVTVDRSPLSDRKEVENHFPAEEVLKGYSVQLGVFSRPDNALHLKKAISDPNVRVHIVKRGIFYVVKAGDYPDIGQARDLCDRLQSEGFTAFISEP